MKLLEEYTEFVYEICSDASKVSEKELLNTSALGLNEEAGEVAGIVKKHFYHGHAFDRSHFIAELGDVLWYAALGARAVGVSLEDVIETNMAKLRNRYKEGKFSTKESLSREREER